MTSELDFKGRWVVVTGASAGLGSFIARELAARGAKLWLVARRADALAELARELSSQHQSECRVLPLDLAEPDAAQGLFERTTRETPVYGLVSNAAIYHFGRFDSLPEVEALRMLRVNALTPIQLLRLFVPYLDQNRGGGVLVVSSTGALMPTPFQAAYGASKTLVHDYVQSLSYERGSSREVVVSLCCPGGMPTELLLSSPVKDRILGKPWLRALLLPPGRVAREAVDAFAQRRKLYVPGLRNRLLVLGARLLPREAVGRGAALVYSEPSE